MAKKSTIRGNWPKYVLQWGSLAALIFFLTGLAVKLFPKMEPANPEAYCPFGGLQALATYFQRGSLPCTMNAMQILMGILLAATVILLSKLFCAYLCPVGTVEDLLMKGRKALGFKGIDIRNGSIADKALRILKYGLLFVVVYFTVTASELFCKNIDPYYAVATGFKGEITLWMSLTALTLVVLLGFVINRFWCRYICPLGAISNTLKFWTWLVALGLLWWAVSLVGIKFSWVWLLGTFCVAGYLLEILHGKPRMQLMHVLVDQDNCGRKCYSCQKNCPYNIDGPSFGEKVTAVDCVLCGECVASCPSKALRIGVAPSAKGCKFSRFIPPIVAAVVLALAFIFGGKFEIPTISETWGIEEGMSLKTVKVSGLKSVKCFGSSMAFKARMEKVPGVHGVKTYVGSHTVVVSYDPSVTDADKIQSKIFVPSRFKVATPDPEAVPELKIVTLRVEKMYDKMDLNYLGLQFRGEDKGIYGVESEYDCPVVVRVFMDPAQDLDESWFKEVVNRKVLVMPIHGGGTKETPMGLKFVKMEKETGSISTPEFLHLMFTPFKAEYNGRYPSADTTIVRKRAEVYAGKPQYILEFENSNYEKPIVVRSLPYLSNHVSKEEGVIGTYLVLNENLKPAIQIRFAAPATAERIWELVTMEKWTITYKDEEKIENARIAFDKPGVVKPYKQ